MAANSNYSCNVVNPGAQSYPYLRWPKMTIKVYFRGYKYVLKDEHEEGKMSTVRVMIGDNSELLNSRMILDWANIWSDKAKEAGAVCVPTFERTDVLDDSDIRVHWTITGESSSDVGVVATSKGKVDSTMFLNLSDDGPRHSRGDPKLVTAFKKFLVVHEFGHALGLGHGNQARQLDGLLDKTKTIEFLMTEMEEEDAKKKFKKDYQIKDGAGIEQPPKLDGSSVMCYPIDASCFVKPKPGGLTEQQYSDITTMTFSSRTEPSDGDIQTVIALYTGEQERTASDEEKTRLKIRTAADMEATMTELIAFQCIDGKTIDISDSIPEERYKRFGELILQYPDSPLPPNIPNLYGGAVSQVVHDILRKWVNGEGMRDRTWRGLIGVLKRVKQDALLELIVNAKDMPIN